MRFRPGIILFVAAALSVAALAQRGPAPAARFRYAPVETQHFDLDLTARAQYTFGGEEHATESRIRATVRLIPFKTEKKGRMHLMAMIDEGTLERTSDGAKDTVDLHPWVTKRIELVIDPQGVVRQSLDIEHLPGLQIPGLARAEENGMKALLSSLFPRLPSGTPGKGGSSATFDDSLKMKYPDKVIVRKWKENLSWKPAEAADSVARFTYKSRIAATEMIYPVKDEAAEMAEDIVTTGSYGISASGKLTAHDRNSTIYRSIRPLSPNSPGSVEETTTILLHLRRR